MAFTQRSEETRAAILTAARRRFADDGYERATIRAIAADAGHRPVDGDALLRLEGRPVRRCRRHRSAPAVLRRPGARAARRGPRTALPGLWEGGRPSDALTVLLRSAVTNEAAAERVRTVFATQVEAVIGSAEDDGPTRAGLVASQLLGVALCRYILRLPPVVALDAETMVAALAPTVQRYLTAPLA